MFQMRKLGVLSESIIQCSDLCSTNYVPEKIEQLNRGVPPIVDADVDDLVSEFDYKPNMSVKQGVEKVAEWYKEFHRIDDK